MPKAANDPSSPTMPSDAATSLAVFRHPRREDGGRVNQLIEASGTLDTNSLYCNFLQCTHFASTCLLAEERGEVIGWVSAYRPPEEPQTLFVWQVAVAEAARGRGLARRLVAALLERPGCEGVNRLRTTITPDNRASWALFTRLAESLGADLRDEVWLCRERHFAEAHDSEHMLTIGPFAPATAPRADAA